MTKTFARTTAKGAKVAFTVEINHITTETVSADGHEFDIACDRYTYRVTDMTVNGSKPAMQELWTERNQRCIKIGMSGKDRLLIALTDDEVSAIYGEEMARNAEKLENAIKAERAHKAHTDAVYAMMLGD